MGALRKRISVGQNRCGALISMSSYNQGVEYSRRVLGIRGDFRELCIQLRRLCASYYARLRAGAVWFLSRLLRMYSISSRSPLVPSAEGSFLFGHFQAN